MNHGVNMHGFSHSKPQHLVLPNFFCSTKKEEDAVKDEGIEMNF